MKTSTEVWAKFESKGHPDSTTIVHGTVYNVMAEHIKWIQLVKMGSFIRTTYARSEMELNTHTSQRKDAVHPDDDMMNELLAGLAQDNLGLETSNEDN